MTRARTLLVAVESAFFNGIVEWVANDPRIEIVGKAHSGSQALEVLRALPVELVLIDVTLPDLSGFDLVRRIKSRPGAPLVVLLSFHDSRAARGAALAAGADGFLSKSETADRLFPLVGDLLRQRKETVREKGPGLETMRVPPESVSQ